MSTSYRVEKIDGIKMEIHRPKEGPERLLWNAFCAQEGPITGTLFLEARDGFEPPHYEPMRVVLEIKENEEERA